MKVRVEKEGNSWVATFSHNPGVITTLIIDANKYDRVDIEEMVSAYLRASKNWKR